MTISGNWDRRLSRRRFVGAGGAGAAALVLGFGPYTEKALSKPSFGGDPFSLGVAAGKRRVEGARRRSRETDATRLRAQERAAGER